MNREKLQALIVPPEASMRDVMEAINRTGSGIAIVCDTGGRLQGVITDGDVRRALLGGASLGASAAPFMCKSPITAAPGATDAALLDLMNTHSIRHLIVVDEDLRVMDLVALTDLVRELRPRLALPAVVMAGGLGSRLGELTRETPKPLLEVGGKPIIERIVDRLRDQGVDEVIITTRHLAEQIEQHFAGRDAGVAIDYVRERERLGTAGALKYLEGTIDGSFLVMNGDLLTDLDVGKLVDFHQRERPAMTVAVRHYALHVPFGVVQTSGNRVVGLSEKPTLDLVVNAGIYVLEPAVFGYIPAETYFDITELIERLLAAGLDVATFPIVERWLDVGRPEDLARAREMYDDES